MRFRFTLVADIVISDEAAQTRFGTTDASQAARQAQEEAMQQIIAERAAVDDLPIESITCTVLPLYG